MPRYIDVEAFLKHEEEIYCKDCDHRKNSKGKMVYAIGDAPCRACGICDVMGDVEDFPTADVVEIVRCKDCKRYDCEDGDMKCIKDADWDEETAHYYGFVAYHNPGWFCAGGERRAE